MGNLKTVMIAADINIGELLRHVVEKIGTKNNETHHSRLVTSVTTKKAYTIKDKTKEN